MLSGMATSVIGTGIYNYKQIFFFCDYFSLFTRIKLEDVAKSDDKE